MYSALILVMKQSLAFSRRRDILRLGGGLSLALALSAPLFRWIRDTATDHGVLRGREVSFARGGSGLAGSSGTSLSPVEAEHFNLVLNLEYVGAQFYSYAAGGIGVPLALQTGTGLQGEAVGGRSASFTDPSVRRYASELANDRSLRLARMREHLLEAAAAQPTIDLSVSPASPFSVAARGAGLISVDGVFDPFGGDDNFLLSAFFMENLVSAAYRSMVAHVTTDLPKQAAAQNLANAIYHGGLVRAVIAGKAQQNPALLDSCTSLCTYMAQLDGSTTGDGSPGNDTTASSNLFDAQGRHVPFTRSPKQILSTLYLAPGAETPGGFLPHGANGLATLA